jgi:type II restriction/modification system DNA methylase subunit YeeA
MSELKWFPVNKGGEFRRWFGNNFFVVNFENNGKTICDYIDNTPGVKVKSNGRVINRDRYFREGLTWSTISSAEFSLRYSPQGSLFETKGAMIFFDDQTETKAVLGLLNTKITSHLLKATSPTLDFHEGPIGRLPILISDVTINIESKARAEQAVDLAKSDWDAYETSWDFTTLPLLQPDQRAETLEHTYTTLRTHWQGMTDEMQRLEEENNRIFIDAYGLQDELTPEVPLNEITLTCNPAYRYGGNASDADRETRLRADTVAEFLSYAVGCMFGRYSLDAPGLILANQGETLADYLARIPEPQFMPDKDNVIPLFEEDWFEDDAYQRFREFLALTFGPDRLVENLEFMRQSLGKEVRTYLAKDFYADHVQRYKKRPIYWLVSSPKGAFQALIYMHRYTPDTLNITLNDYVRALRDKLEAGLRTAKALEINQDASAAEKNRAKRDIDRFAKQIAEVTEWERDILYPLAVERIPINLDDGVKRNYPRFPGVLKPIKGLEADDA